MSIVPFATSHIESFLAAARSEGWITGRREMEFLLKSYPKGCFVSETDGRPAGFITATRYSNSAWIGNLLVLHGERGKGIGRELMKRVLNSLDLFGCRTLWLTASPEGAPLYRTLGFIEIDRVQRWRGRAGRVLSVAGAASADDMARIDSLGWGDNRRLIFDSLPEESTVFSGTYSFLVSSPFEDGRHIGPWGAGSVRGAADLLDAAIGGGGEIDTFLDLPESNSSAREILLSKGFSVTGGTLLMYRGMVPEYRPQYLYALASMGSYG